MRQLRAFRGIEKTNNRYIIKCVVYVEDRIV